MLLVFFSQEQLHIADVPLEPWSVHFAVTLDMLCNEEGTTANPNKT